MAEVERSMSSRELAEWQAFARLEPIGVDRLDFLAALICTTVANSNRSSKQKPYEIKDFLVISKSYEKRKPLDQQVREAMTKLKAGKNRGK